MCRKMHTNYHYLINISFVLVHLNVQKDTYKLSLLINISFVLVHLNVQKDAYKLSLFN